MANTADTNPGKDTFPRGARGFPGKGSEEGKNITLADLLGHGLPDTAQSVHELTESALPTADKSRAILTVTGTKQGLRRLEELLAQAKAQGTPFKVAGVEVIGITTSKFRP